MIRYSLNSNLDCVDDLAVSYTQSIILFSLTRNLWNTIIFLYLIRHCHFKFNTFLKNWYFIYALIPILFHLDINKKHVLYQIIQNNAYQLKLINHPLFHNDTWVILNYFQNTENNAHFAHNYDGVYSLNSC